MKKTILIIVACFTVIALTYAQGGATTLFRMRNKSNGDTQLNFKGGTLTIEDDNNFNFLKDLSYGRGIFYLG